MEDEKFEILKIDEGGEGLQMISIETAKQWYEMFVSFATQILKKGLDYGTIPGTDKPTLYKPGAEKLRFAFGLGVETENKERITDLQNLFIDYTYNSIVRSKTGQILAMCEGSCNSWEPNYRYTWKQRIPAPEKLEADKLKADGIGKWKNLAKKGDKANFAWFDRLDNDQVIAKKNTIMKIATKRSFVGAILLATGASEFFTQDLEAGEDEDNQQPGEEKENWDADLLDQWKKEINNQKTQADLSAFFKTNSKAILESETLKKLMKIREDDIKKLSGKGKADKAVDDLEKKMHQKK